QATDLGKLPARINSWHRITGCQRDQLLTPNEEKRIWHHDQCASLTLDHSREGCLKIAFSGGCQHLQVSPNSVGRRFYLGYISPGVRIVWINKQGDRAGRGEQLTQKLQTL